MTTAEILKQLESAKSEAEMLVIAKRLGVTRAFFNAGSVVDLAAKPAPKKIASKDRIKGKRTYAHILTEPNQPKKQVHTRSLGA